jgi:hypothetical protein
MTPRGGSGGGRGGSSPPGFEWKTRAGRKGPGKKSSKISSNLHGTFAYRFDDKVARAVRIYCAAVPQECAARVQVVTQYVYCRTLSRSPKWRTAGRPVRYSVDTSKIRHVLTTNERRPSANKSRELLCTQKCTS